MATFLVAPEPADLKLTIEGIERTAIVYSSSISNKPVPIVFVFHGFTGSGRQAAFSYRVHEAWSEATVVYPQGLNVDLLGRRAPGWQIAPKLQEDRDLKFFDAILKKLKADYRADTTRIYTCGMSNGAIFSYVLLTERGKEFAAAAPVAGFAPPAFKGAPATPILIIHGKTDALLGIKLAENSRDVAIDNNKSGKSTKEWIPGFLQYTPVSKENDVIWNAHEGGHIWPQGATAAIVKFFKLHQRK